VKRQCLKQNNAFNLSLGAEAAVINCCDVCRLPGLTWMEQLSQQSRARCSRVMSVTGGMITHCILSQTHYKLRFTAAAR